MPLPVGSFLGWSGVLFFSVMVLPVILSWLPVIFGFLINTGLWLAWILKYRNDK